MGHIASQRALFLKHLAPTSTSPLLLEVARAEGSYLYDIEGKAFLDLISGISVSALGHGHPKIKEAIKEQSERHLHTMVYGEFMQAPQTAYAAWLADRLPSHLDCVYFTNSGTEATEGAMKLAKRWTGRHRIASFIHSYHGSSQGALSLGGDEEFRQSFRPLLPGIDRLRYNHEADLELISEDTAAVFVEPVQAEAGVLVPEPSFLVSLKERCQQVGAMLVFDEIQAGFGRAGSQWAFEQTAVSPDILLLGKALGGGLPLGAFVASYTAMQSLAHDPVLGHITTFGGHPLSCAAGLAMARTLEEEGHILQVPEKVVALREGLGAYHSRLRSSGLLMALEVGTFEQVLKLIEHCAAEGIITDWFLFNNTSVRIAPPLNIQISELQRAASILASGLSKFL